MLEYTQDEADRHDRLFTQGWNMMGGSILLETARVKGKPGWVARYKLKKAMRCFELALEINPQGWESMWALGKIHQRLGDYRASFDWLLRAHRLNSSQPDVAREAGLAALGCGEGARAVGLCQAAVESNPNDPGLVCNLALAHLVCGDDVAAIQSATEAVGRAKEDPVAKNVLDFIRDVHNGKRPRPKTLEDILRI